MKSKLMAFVLVAAAVGCDPSNSDPGGPVTLVRIMVQDSQPYGVRGVAMDLLDTLGSPYSTAVRCDANTPCVPQFMLGGVAPDVSCTQAGVCTDPLTAIDVPAFTNQTGHTLSAQTRDGAVYIFKIVKRR